MKERYPFLVRLLFIFPIMILMGVIYGIISIFSTVALAKVLKDTSDNILKP